MAAILVKGNAFAYRMGVQVKSSTIEYKECVLWNHLFFSFFSIFFFGTIFYKGKHLLKTFFSSPEP